NGGPATLLYRAGRGWLMPPEGSVTRWVDLLQAGNSDAVQAPWQRYFPRLAGPARKKMHDAPRRPAHAGDVALAACYRSCPHAAEGRFPQLADRDSLWRILVVMTARKASHLLRDETRQKRGGGAVVRSEADAAATEPPLLEQLLSREPTPELAACMAEE